MNIDERLEALTMNLELLSRDLEDMKAVSGKHDEQIAAVVAVTGQNGEHIAALAVAVQLDGENIRALAGISQNLDSAVRQDGENIRSLTAIAQTTHDSIKRLENIAVAHEDRLDDLESH